MKYLLKCLLATYPCANHWTTVSNRRFSVFLNGPNFSRRTNRKHTKHARNRRIQVTLECAYFPLSGTFYEFCPFRGIQSTQFVFETGAPHRQYESIQTITPESEIINVTITSVVLALKSNLR